MYHFARYWCLSLGTFSVLFGFLVICDDHENAFSSREWTGSDFRTCESLGGVGSFDTTCLLHSNCNLESDLYVYGSGNLDILPHVSVSCVRDGCAISIRLSGNVNIGQYSSIVAGSIALEATNLTMSNLSSLNTTALGGKPPSQTSGTPIGYDRAGGGYGGRGASCINKNKSANWGGDVYAWSTLAEPTSYGSKGGGSAASKYGGNGGGCVHVKLNDVLYLNGSINSEGGNGGLESGGGSGGSIFVYAKKLNGFGSISAAGGSGWGGGGGGRISIFCYSILEDLKVSVRGGESHGCLENSGAAGTYFNAHLLCLRVDNDNLTTQTETPLFDFSTMPLWSNVIVQNRAKVLVPLLWTRVQVRGQISVYGSSCITFGLSAYPVSEFELVAEELLMSDSIIKVYGAFRVTVKMLLMWNSGIEVDAGGKTVVSASALEIRNLIVLRKSSVISSNANLAVYGLGLLQLTGQGDAINGQRLSLSLFYNISVGRGSLLQAPFNNDASRGVVTEPHCGNRNCLSDLITPPDDCHVNYTLSFSLQICRVEDVLVEGIIWGSVIHIHRARHVIIHPGGSITSSGLGCSMGSGVGRYVNGTGSGAGHGGCGGPGYFTNISSVGGKSYGNAALPCELGSGAEVPDSENVIGGGIIVMGSMYWPLWRLDVLGSLKSDGQSLKNFSKSKYNSLLGGPGGASGGTILLFLEKLVLVENSTLSVVGGDGSHPGGGGGGGGRVHFHWSKITVGDEYVPVASIDGTINYSGGAGNNGGLSGNEGTVTGKECPKGLYGTFCEECPVGTFKGADGSKESLCTSCSSDRLPYRASFIYIRGGVVEEPCPYKCKSEKYKMPNCYTPLEELVYAFGGPFISPLLFAFVLLFIALLLNIIRFKLIKSSSYPTNSFDRRSDHQLPFLLSLSEVRGTKIEETQSHVHRMYFSGPNSFREPWHLPHYPPNSIIKIVYEDAFNKFIDEINSIAVYEWWEGSVHSILAIFAYPCSWLWKQWRRKKKLHSLQNYVKSKYDHSCLRSCRSRALYKGMKVGGTPDLMLAYIDFFLGGDEKRLDIASIIHNRFPMCIIVGGNGTYMSPYNLHCDTLLTNLLAQHVPESVWKRLVAGLNAQLRTVKQGSTQTTLRPLLEWLNSHADAQLNFHGFRVQIGWFQPTPSGYYQLGIIVMLKAYQNGLIENNDESQSCDELYDDTMDVTQLLSWKKIAGEINGGPINDSTCLLLECKSDVASLILYNSKPSGHEETRQIAITVILLADLFITLFLLLQCYWTSIVNFLSVLLILPLSFFFSFPVGLNALFSKEPKRASLTRIYALWNATSLSNVFVAFICGAANYGYSLISEQQFENAWIDGRDDYYSWWLLPTILLLLKTVHAHLVNLHIARLEIQDDSLYSPDPLIFWEQELGY